MPYSHAAGGYFLCFLCGAGVDDDHEFNCSKEDAPPRVPKDCEFDPYWRAQDQAARVSS